jgi:serine/threonine protein kinase
LDQLGKIFAALGTPDESSWPGVSTLPDYVEFTKTTAPPLREVFSAASKHAVDLLSRMLTLDPNKRYWDQSVLVRGVVVYLHIYIYIYVCVCVWLCGTRDADRSFLLIFFFFFFSFVRRISASDALQHPYFTSEPAPTPPEKLPRPAVTEATTAASAGVMEKTWTSEDSSSDEGEARLRRGFKRRRDTK